MKPYVSANTGESSLLLDDYVCHKIMELNNILQTLGTTSPITALHDTSWVQICDVGIKKPLKDRMKKCAER